MLDRAIFEQYTGELEKYFSRTLTDFAREVWYQKLEHLTNQQYAIAVAKAIASEQFFPTPVKMLELAGKPELPTENRQAYIETSLASLPSEQMRMSDEQRLMNIQRLKALSKGIGQKPQQTPKPDYKKVAQDLKRAWIRSEELGYQSFSDQTKASLEQIEEMYKQDE